MPRRMEAAWASFAANTVTDVVTVPADHKYELLSGVISRNPATDQLSLWALDNAPGYLLIGSHVESDNYAVVTNWTALVAYEGDVVQVYNSAGAGECLLTYVDVDFS